MGRDVEKHQVGKWILLEGSRNGGLVAEIGLGWGVESG